VFQEPKGSPDVPGRLFSIHFTAFRLSFWRGTCRETLPRPVLFGHLGWVRALRSRAPPRPLPPKKHRIVGSRCGDGVNRFGELVWRLMAECLVSFDRLGEAMCPHCGEADWRLLRRGRVGCAQCRGEHPHIAWYDDEADVIARVGAESYSVDSEPLG
jgi:hypothetical protein